MLDIFALAFSLLAIAAFMRGFRETRPHRWFALAGLAFGLVGRLQMERIVSARGLHRHRRGASRLLQGWQRAVRRTPMPTTGTARDLWPDFRLLAFRRVLRAASGARLSRDLRPALWTVDLCHLSKAQRRILQRQHHHAIAGHTYMSAWPSWPFLVRPVWYLFDKVGDDRIAAIVLLGNPLVLWPALPALAVCLRD